MKKWLGGVALVLCLSGCALMTGAKAEWSCSDRAFFAEGQRVMNLDSLQVGRVVGCQRGKTGDVYRARTAKGKRFKVLAQRAAAVGAGAGQVETTGE